MVKRLSDGRSLAFECNGHAGLFVHDFMSYVEVIARHSSSSARELFSAVASLIQGMDAPCVL